MVVWMIVYKTWNEKKILKKLPWWSVNTFYDYSMMAGYSGESAGQRYATDDLSALLVNR